MKDSDNQDDPDSSGGTPLSIAPERDAVVKLWCRQIQKIRGVCGSGADGCCSIMMVLKWT